METLRSIDHQADNPNKAPRSMRFKLISSAELLKAKPMKWLVQGVFPSTGLATIYGASGSGKSFLTLDLGCTLAGEGKKWFGRRVMNVPVTYVCLEGEAGMSKRMQAWLSHHKKPVPSMLHFIAQPFDLLSNDLKDLADAIDERSGTNGLLIIDTFNRASPGSDENSSVDMGKLIAACKTLQGLVGGLVLLVHHTGKKTKNGMRGHSSLHAAMDGEIEVSDDFGQHEWSIAKSKDDITGISHPFNLKRILLGEDPEGEAITSCVIAEDYSIRPAKSKGKPRRLGRNQAIALEILKKLLTPVVGIDGASGESVSTSSISYDEAVLKIGNSLSVDDKHKKSRAMDAISGLVKLDLIRKDGTNILQV